MQKGMQLEKLLSVIKWVKVNRRTIGINVRTNLRNHFWIFQNISDTILKLELLEFFGYSSLFFFSSSHDKYLEKGILFGNYTLFIKQVYWEFTIFIGNYTLFIKQAYCGPGRMRDKMLGYELVKVSCTMFSWTLDKAEHTEFAFLNSEDKAEGACAPVWHWQTNDRVPTKMGDGSGYTQCKVLFCLETV